MIIINLKERLWPLRVFAGEDSGILYLSYTQSVANDHDVKIIKFTTMEVGSKKSVLWSSKISHKLMTLPFRINISLLFASNVFIHTAVRY